MSNKQLEEKVKELEQKIETLQKTVEEMKQQKDWKDIKVGSIVDLVGSYIKK